MTTEILFKFAKKGINLSPTAYEKIIGLEDPLDFSSSLIVKLKSQEFSKDDLMSLDSSIVDEVIKTLGLAISDSNNQEEFIPKSQKTLLETEKNSKNESSDSSNISNNSIDYDSISISEGEMVENTINTNKNNNTITNSNVNNNKNNNTNNTNNYDNSITKPLISESKRNLTPCNVDYNFKIIQDTSKKSYTSGEIGNLITYFKNRYAKLSNILSRRPELKAYQKISDLEEGSTDLNLIVMVREIRTTKNGHKIVEFEDDTGDISVLFHKNNEKLFILSDKLVKDEVIGLMAEKKGDLAIASKIINPGVPRISKKPMDFAAVFTSDIHIGSLTFLEDAFVRFTNWINGDFGTEEQKNIANDVKYLVVGGDIVDGIGIYPNQDKELAIKDITEQYDEAARLLGNIRSDVKIIIAPGNHDASRVAEPQPAVPEKYAKSLYELNNTEFVSNPAIVSLDGLNTLIYHGRGFDDIAITVKGFSHQRNDLIMEELLNKRHLAPIYGERTPLASELEDYLVIDNIPDILHTGHVHINSYKNYNGVHMINSGTFQTQTEFQKIYNIVPTCAEVSILHKGVYKQLKFI